MNCEAQATPDTITVKTFCELPTRTIWSPRPMVRVHLKSDKKARTLSLSNPKFLSLKIKRFATSGPTGPRKAIRREVIRHPFGPHPCGTPVRCRPSNTYQPTLGYSRVGGAFGVAIWRLYRRMSHSVGQRGCLGSASYGGPAPRVGQRLGPWFQVARQVSATLSCYPWATEPLKVK